MCRFGAPISIHSDQGRAFESCLFTELCELLGIHKTCTTPYHSLSDGLAECFNRTLWMLLLVHLEQVPKNTWDNHLPALTKCILAYPCSVHESTRFTPFQLMFGHEAHLPIDLAFGGGPTPGKTHGEYVEHLCSRLEKAYQTVRENMHSVQKHEKQLYDWKHWRTLSSW